ncbi:MAG: hypothetical protein WCP69_01125 [Bacteroidota bacterium]
MNNLLETFKPAIPRRYLMFVAAFVWLYAGGMLLFKGVSFLDYTQSFLILKLIISTVLGLLFFMLLFTKIAAKHVSRILNIKYEKPCLFSFFNWKSYFMMGSMITLGVLLRVFKVVPIQQLSFLYLVMGIPLLISAFKFFNVGLHQK